MKKLLGNYKTSMKANPMKSDVLVLSFDKLRSVTAVN